MTGFTATELGVLARLGVGKESLKQEEEHMSERSRWAVKVRRYGGGTSVVGVTATREEAERVAAGKNAAYQSDNYYAEEWRDE